MKDSIVSGILFGMAFGITILFVVALCSPWMF